MSLHTVITVTTPTWVQEVMNNLKGDPVLQPVITELLVAPNFRRPYTYTHGILRYKTRIVVGQNTELREKIARQCHETPVGGTQESGPHMSELNNISSGQS